MRKDSSGFFTPPAFWGILHMSFEDFPGLGSVMGTEDSLRLKHVNRECS